MNPIKQTNDHVESWIVRVTSHVTRTRSGRRMKETSASSGVSCPSLFEDAMCTYVAPPPNIVNF